MTARVQTDEGLEGVGWTYSHGTSGRGMKEAIDTLLAPHIMGEDPAYIERLYDRMWKSVFPKHHHVGPDHGGPGAAGHCVVGPGGQGGR